MPQAVTYIPAAIHIKPPRKLNRKSTMDHSFPNFFGLPLELRLDIWKYAIQASPGPRAHYFGISPCFKGDSLSACSYIRLCSPGSGNELSPSRPETVGTLTHFNNDGLWNACEESRNIMLKTAKDNNNKSISTSRGSTGSLTHFSTGDVWGTCHEAGRYMQEQTGRDNWSIGASKGSNIRHRARLSATGVLHDGQSGAPHLFNVFPGQDLFVFSARQLASLGQNLVSYLRIGSETFYTESLKNVAVDYDIAWDNAATSDGDLSGGIEAVIAGLNMFPGATVYMLDYKLKCGSAVAKWERETGKCATAFTARNGRFVSIYGLGQDLSYDSDEDYEVGVNSLRDDGDAMGSFELTHALRLQLDESCVTGPGKRRMPLDYDVLAWIPSSEECVF